MLLILQIAAGVILGIVLAKWLSGLPHRLRAKRYARSLLALPYKDLMLLAIEGYEQIFSMPNRDWLIELSFCKDEAKKRDLAARIANDDRKQLDLLRESIHDLAKTIKIAEKLGIRGPAEEKPANPNSENN